MTSDPFHMFMTCATPQRQVTRHQSFGGCKGCRVVNCWYCYMSCLMGTMKPIVPLTNPEHMHYPNVNFAMLCCSWCAWRHKPHWVRAAGSSSGLGYWVADPTSSSARQGHVWWHQPSGCPSYGKNTPVSCLAHLLHLGVQRFIRKFSGIHEVLCQARTVYRHFSGTYPDCVCPAEMQHQHQLPAILAIWQRLFPSSTSSRPSTPPSLPPSLHHAPPPLSKFPWIIHGKELKIAPFTLFQAWVAPQ